MYVQYCSQPLGGFWKAFIHVTDQNSLANLKFVGQDIL